MKKAVFQIPSYDTTFGRISMNMYSDEPEFIDYEVQTNPSEITLTYSKERITGVENPLTTVDEVNQGPQRAVTAKLSVKKRLKMTLEIDLLKEYNSLTNTLRKRGNSITESAGIVGATLKYDGIVAGVHSVFNELSKPVSLSDIDLFTDNYNICIFNKLKVAAENNFPVRFVWGSIMADTGYFEGRIEELSANITYFSPEWNALRASVNITMKES